MAQPLLPATAAFLIVAAALVISSVLTVALRNLFRAAMALGAALLCVAILFLLLGAEFLGMAQVLVYIGAVLTLIIFAVMLTSGLVDPRVPQSITRPWLPAIAAAALFGLLRQAIKALPWTSTTASPPAGPGALGVHLVTTYALPFEMISVLFVAVMIGALVLAGRKR